MMEQDGVEGGVKLHKDVSIFICPTCVHFHSLTCTPSQYLDKGCEILTVCSISINVRLEMKSVAPSHQNQLNIAKLFFIK